MRGRSRGVLGLQQMIDLALNSLGVFKSRLGLLHQPLVVQGISQIAAPHHALERIAAALRQLHAFAPPPHSLVQVANRHKELA